ncbi:MAG: M67 family metallopeptidase [Alphaproteobacteria bacterium]
MIQLPGNPKTAIIRHAESEYPCEACGLLLGRRLLDHVLVSEVVPSPYIADKQSHNFEIDPGLRLRIQKANREGGNRIVGHYHTHPDGEAAPSATDRSRIYETDLIWLIGSVHKGRFSDLAAFVPSIQGEGFDKVSLNWAGDC